MSWTTREKPAFSTKPASGPPMFPKPMNPTRIVSSSVWRRSGLVIAAYHTSQLGWPEGSLAMKVAVMGTGAIGGYVGARLAAAGAEVTFIARGAHLVAIRTAGIRVLSPLGDVTISPASATDDPRTVGAVDVVLLGTKLYDVEAAAR